MLEQPDYSYIEKREVEEEDKKKYWLYICKHCGTTLLSIDVAILATVLDYEEKQVKKT